MYTPIPNYVQYLKVRARAQEPVHALPMPVPRMDVFLLDNVDFYQILSEATGLQLVTYRTRADCYTTEQYTHVSLNIEYLILETTKKVPISARTTDVDAVMYRFVVDSCTVELNTRIYQERSNTLTWIS